jgi:DNA-binding CsgD family transcriptional regulator
MADKMQARVDALTPRQREVVRLTSLGCNASEIAKVLGIARATVDNHRNRAMLTLGTNRLVLMLRIAIKYRITSMNDRLSAAERKKRGKRKDVWN